MRPEHRETGGWIVIHNPRWVRTVAGLFCVGQVLLPVAAAHAGTGGTDVACRCSVHNARDFALPADPPFTNRPDGPAGSGIYAINW